MSDTENHRKPLISEPLRTVVLSGVLALSSLAVLATAAAREPETFTERVQFAPGTSKDILAGALAPGESRRSVVNARDKQMLIVSLLPNNAETHFNVFVPDGELLFTRVSRVAINTRVSSTAAVTTS